MRTMRRRPMLPPVTPDPPSGELERVVYDELLGARAENRPVSRQSLRKRLSEEKKIPGKAAYAVVETFCDEFAPSTPEYLRQEFLVPYLKFLATLPAILCCGMVIWFAVDYWRMRSFTMWTLYAAGACFVVGAIVYTRGLLGERRRKA